MAHPRLGQATWIAVAAVAFGLASAGARAWTCDDAYISFRYADNLARGLGLVFNAGERVEGMTNLLWTLFVSAGLKLGVRPERWTAVFGLAAYGGAIALLARQRRAVVPIAALVAACHVEWAVYATSGLETSAVTLLALGAYHGAIAGRSAGSGLLLALAALTRPDALLFTPIILVYLGWSFGPKRALVALAAFAAAWGPATIARVQYYGSFFPNTYYAKSAMIPWWSQGLLYLGLYFLRYWPLLLALPLGLVALRRAHGRTRGELALALGLAIAYTLYVARVGGDFMFARLLIPAAPFFAILLEGGVAAVLDRRPQLVAAAAAAAAMLLTPSPVDGQHQVAGIDDEHAVYGSTIAGWELESERRGAVLRRYFDGLPVRVCFLGAEARLVYASRVATAIECETGLTDAFIAHLPLPARGRVGHEKRPPLDYLLDRRAVHFTLNPQWSSVVLGLDRELPLALVDLDGVPLRLLTWDPPLMAALRARGARFLDLPAMLDGYIAVMPHLPDAQVREDYRKAKRLYFDRVADSTRQAAFERRLAKR